MLITYPNIAFGVMHTLYRLTGADMNAITDQPLVKLHGYSAFILQAVFITNVSTSLTTAVGGFYTGAAKSGITIVPANQAYSVANAANTGIACAMTAAGRGRIVADPILALSTPQGAAATADIYITGFGIL